MELVLELLVFCEACPWLLCLVIMGTYPFKLDLEARPSMGLVECSNIGEMLSLNASLVRFLPQCDEGLSFDDMYLSLPDLGVSCDRTAISLWDLSISLEETFFSSSDLDCSLSDTSLSFHGPDLALYEPIPSL